MYKSNIAFENLRVEMARNNITINDISIAIKVQRTAVSEKLSRKRPIKLDEAYKIKNTFFPMLDVEFLFKEICDNQNNSAS